MSEIFDRLLGYRQFVGADGVHHMEPETSSKAVKGYRPPDARLGWFGAGTDCTRAVVELKAPGADLDAKQNASYGRLTPVEQAFGYAAKVDGCRWVIVSNFVSLRLYRTDRGQGYCQSFELAELLDPDRLSIFLFLLSRQTLFGTADGVESPVERLASRTNTEEARITKEFYVFYRDLRLDLFYQLRRDNPSASADQGEVHEAQLLEHAQKLLDRCLFICFCEDTGLLPAKVLTRALTARSVGFVQVSRWQQLCGLFDAVDRGYPPMQINGYNGGLFAKDQALDALTVSEEALDGISALADYDFETDLNVNILGHIFEQSITDLEAIHAEIRGEIATKQRSRRKREGVFYTPELITRFMASRTIGGWLAERYAKLDDEHRTGKPGPMSKETRLKILVDYLEVLRSIKVLDLACGSGAFLVAAFDYLIGEYERVNQAIAAQSGAPGQMGLFDLDVVIGNPPYVRQEALGPIKPYLARRYASYHGVADLYVYFYERGLELLAPGGKLSYIVTNKWLRAGYGEPLRKLFSERAELEEILDFGHAPIFEDADVFPCIIVAHPHPGSQAATGDPPQVSICPVPRDRSTELSLVNYVLEHGYSVPWSRYGAQPWSLEPPEVDKLMQKIRERGVPLADFVDAKPMYGIKTGLNEAFLIDDATRTALIRDDPGCAEIIKPYLRGQDIKRWTPDWQGLWMILLKSSGDYEWPWSTLGDDAEAVFARTYPGLYAHVKPLQQRLMARRDKGRFWWELRSCDYYGAFERAKIVYQVIQFHPQYALDATGPFGNDKTFFLPSSDRYVLAVLNSALMWWHNWRYLPHMKDEALNPAGFRMETVPIAEPATELRDEIEEHVDAVLALTRESQECSRELFNWLRLQLGIEKLGQRLAAFADLSGDEFVAEVRKRRPKDASRLTPAAITELNGIHHHYVDPERRRAAEIRVLERRISDLVNQAYQLTNEEIDLLWRTAPPRMPQL